MRGLVQAPVFGAQSFDKITCGRERDSFLQGDVHMAAAVGGEVLNPPGAAPVQPRLYRPDVGFNPVDTSNGRVKVEEDRPAGAVLPKNPDRCRRCRQTLGQVAFVFLRI